MHSLAPVFVLATILAFIASREHGSFALPHLPLRNLKTEDGLFTIVIALLAAVLVMAAAGACGAFQ